MLAFLLTSWSLLALAWGYSSGAPPSTCQDMFPAGHGVDARPTVTPYTIAVNATSYSPGDVIEVTVGGGSSSFKGLFLQARRLENCFDVTPVGTFSLDVNDTELKTISCGNTQIQNSVTHGTSSEKMNKVFTWNAPQQSVGHVYFRATFVQSTEVFWTTTESDFITDRSSNAQLPPQSCNPSTQGGNGASTMSYLTVTMLLTSLMFIPFTQNFL